MDLINPSPAIGWASQERMAFQERPKPDCIMALALIHHLAISNNLPFAKIAHYFSNLGEDLIIEFVPKEDSQVQKLFASRVDIFPNYHEAGFEKSFGQYFHIEEKQPIENTVRTMYWLRRK